MINKINKCICILLLPLLVSVCGKKGSGGSEPKEETLQVTIDPNPGTAVAASLGAVYDFKVIVNSKMPAQGIKIDVLCTKDADNTTVASQSLNSTSTSTSVLVNNLQQGVLCTVKVVVTSLGQSTNTASVTFKVARK